MREPRFDYVVDVPNGVYDALPWTARLRELPEPDPALPYPRARRVPAVGSVARVVLDDFEARLGVLRTRVRFLADDQQDAAFREVSFVVERRFARMLKAGDVISAATSLVSSAFGVSVMRDGYLVAAAGAVRHVPLGDVVTVRHPSDLAGQVHHVYSARDPQYRLREVPIEVVTDEGIRLMHGGRAQFGRYDFFVVHGFVDHAECMAITCLGICPEVAATLTAPVINARDSAQWVPWKTSKDLRLERDFDVLVHVEQGRLCLERGDVDAAYDAAMLALMKDGHCDAVIRLLEEIERRRR